MPRTILGCVYFLAILSFGFIAISFAPSALSKDSDDGSLDPFINRFDQLYFLSGEKSVLRLPRDKSTRDAHGTPIKSGVLSVYRSDKFFSDPVLSRSLFSFDGSTSTVFSVIASHRISVSSAVAGDEDILVFNLGLEQDRMLADRFAGDFVALDSAERRKNADCIDDGCCLLTDVLDGYAAQTKAFFEPAAASGDKSLSEQKCYMVGLLYHMGLVAAARYPDDLLLESTIKVPDFQNGGFVTIEKVSINEGQMGYLSPFFSSYSLTHGKGLFSGQSREAVLKLLRRNVIDSMGNSK